MNFYRELRNTALTLATLLTVGCESDKIAGEVYDKTAFFRKGGGYNLALTIKDSLSNNIIYYLNMRVSEWVDYSSGYGMQTVVDMKNCEPITPEKLKKIIGSPDSIHSIRKNETINDFLNNHDADFFIDESEE